MQHQRPALHGEMRASAAALSPAAGAGCQRGCPHTKGLPNGADCSKLIIRAYREHAVSWTGVAVQGSKLPGHLPFGSTHPGANIATRNDGSWARRTERAVEALAGCPRQPQHHQGATLGPHWVHAVQEVLNASPCPFTSAGCTDTLRGPAGGKVLPPKQNGERTGEVLNPSLTLSCEP